MIQEHAAMLDRLNQAGLLDESLRAAFARHPRHLFVPRHAWLPPRPYTALDRYKDERVWLDAAYGDRPLIIQWNDGHPVDEPATALPTSSVGSPAGVARLLREALLDRDGGTVVEVGTGPGWTTALLAALLDTDRVRTIEIDPAIADLAHTNLRRRGVDVRVHVGDGTRELPGTGDVDRIISRASAATIPAMWIQRTRTGGYILTPWHTGLFNALMLRLQVGEDGTASGRFLRIHDAIMLRSHRPPAADLVLTVDGAASGTSINPRLVLDGGSAHAVIGLLVPDCQLRLRALDAGVVRVDDPITRSAATVPTDARGFEYPVRQYGPRQLWDEITAAYSWWISAGRPDITRFGITARSGEHTVWLDHPDNCVTRATIT